MQEPIGYQIVAVATDDPPEGMTTYQVYTLAFVLEWLAKTPATDRARWRLLPVYPEDIDGPTFPGQDKVTRLTFEIVTTAVWDAEGIEEVADEFAKLYGGDINIDSAWLIRVEHINRPADDDGTEPDESEK